MRAFSMSKKAEFERATATLSTQFDLRDETKSNIQQERVQSKVLSARW